MGWLKDIGSTLSPGQPVYVLLYALAIIFFCFFYTALVFNPKETADNLKKSGAFVPGIRPGEQTARYIGQDSDPIDAGGSDLHHACVFVARVPDFEMECTLLFWWNILAYHCGGDHGFHGAGSGICHVSPIRRHA